MSSPIPRLTDWHGAAQLHPYFVWDVFTSEPLQGNQPAPPGSSPRASPGSPNPEPQAARARCVYRSVCILRVMTDPPNAHDALLGATSELTYENGITGTGVDAIAARAGVTKRNLYQHF